MLSRSMLALLVTACAAATAHAASELADAAMHGDRDALRELVEQGIDVNAAQPDGATALHWAVYRDDLAAVELLIDAGANVTTRIEQARHRYRLQASTATPRSSTGCSMRAPTRTSGCRTARRR